jgi:hypothetical protein
MNRSTQSRAWSGLTEHTEQRAAVLADESLWPDVLEETLRCVSPLGLIRRRARHDTEVEGVPIPAGSTVIALIASANRDGTVYENGEQCDVHRPKSVSFAFRRWGAPLCGDVGGPVVDREHHAADAFHRFDGLRNASDRPCDFAARGLQSHPVTGDVDRGNG